MTETTNIYALIDPRTDRVRYVGKSDHPDDRLKAHLETARSLTQKSPLCLWIRELARDGFRPSLVVLEHPTKSNAYAREEWWIARYRPQGDLCNVRDRCWSTVPEWLWRARRETKTQGIAQRSAREAMTKYERGDKGGRR